MPTEFAARVSYPGTKKQAEKAYKKHKKSADQLGMSYSAFARKCMDAVYSLWDE